MDKVLMGLVLATLATGCTPATKLNIAKAEYLCKDDGGLYAFKRLENNPVQCANGVMFSRKALAAAIIKDERFLPKSRGE